MFRGYINTAEYGKCRKAGDGGGGGEPERKFDEILTRHNIEDFPAHTILDELEVDTC